MRKVAGVADDDRVFRRSAVQDRECAARRRLVGVSPWRLLWGGFDATAEGLSQLPRNRRRVPEDLRCPRVGELAREVRVGRAHHLDKMESNPVKAAGGDSDLVRPADRDHQVRAGQRFHDFRRRTQAHRPCKPRMTVVKRGKPTPPAEHWSTHSVGDRRDVGGALASHGLRAHQDGRPCGAAQ
jgi:hypothetical protein